jgi:hypothetical protein
VHQSIIARGCDTEKRAGNLRLSWIEVQRGRYCTGAIALKLEKVQCGHPATMAGIQSRPLRSMKTSRCR